MIIKPDVPLALRLQSQLLFGISRVFERQVGYVLQDAVKVQSNIKTSRTSVINRDLDSKSAMVR